MHWVFMDATLEKTLDELLKHMEASSEKLDAVKLDFENIQTSLLNLAAAEVDKIREFKELISIESR